MNLKKQKHFIFRIYFIFVVFFCSFIPSFAIFEDNPSFVSAGIYGKAWMHQHFHQYNVQAQGTLVQPMNYRTDPTSWVLYANVAGHNQYASSLGINYNIPFGSYNKDVFKIYGFTDMAYEYDQFVPQLSTGFGFWNGNRYFSMNGYLPLTHFSVQEHVKYKNLFPSGNKYKGDAYYYPTEDTPLWGGDIIVGYIPGGGRLNMYVRTYLYNTFYWGGDMTIQYDLQLGTSYWPRNSKTFLSFYTKAGLDSALFSTYRIGMALTFYDPKYVKEFRPIRQFIPTVKITQQYRLDSGVDVPEQFWPAK